MQLSVFGVLIDIKLCIHFNYRNGINNESGIVSTLLERDVSKSRTFMNFIVKYILKLHDFHHFLTKIRTFKPEFEFRQTSQNHLWF